MPRQQQKLNLGKGAAFAKAQLKRLRQQVETWEADFRALHKPVTQSQTHYRGVVVSQPDGSLLAEAEIQGRPTVNDLATLLATAMRRPLTGKARHPQTLHLPGRPQWRELFSHLKELGVEASVRDELPKVAEAHAAHLRDVQEARRVGMARPTAGQIGVENLFPAVARWVNGTYGHVEIGEQEGFGFVARALDYGGLVFEDDRPRTLAEALAALEKGLRAWFKQEGIELE